METNISESKTSAAVSGAAETGTGLRRQRSEIDMLHGSLADKILLFALPLALTGILQQLFNAADIAVIGEKTI